jgi:hypothetical protein
MFKRQQSQIIKPIFSVILLLALNNQVLAQDYPYLRGYIDALMGNRYPGMGVRARLIDTEGGVTLASSTCLSPSQKRDITRLLQATEKIKTVTWDTRSDCNQTASDTLPVPSEDEIDMRALPEQPMFAPLIADPRQPRFSVSYQEYKISGQTFNASSAAFGEYFGLAAGFLGQSGSSQVGIQGAVFALFDLDSSSKDLINADYWIGIPIDYRKGAWSYLLRIYHQSSHLGDEFILNNPEVTRINLSYEDIELLASYEWERVRLYGGGGYIIHSEPDLEPWHLHSGAEFIHPDAIGGLDWIAAADVQATAELDWDRSYSYRTGFEFKTGSHRRLRLLLEYFDGHSPNGQFFRERLRYTGLGLYFSF